jgi:hypothetical protein
VLDTESGAFLSKAVDQRMPPPWHAQRRRRPQRGHRCPHDERRTVRSEKPSRAGPRYPACPCGKRA